jgi:hypothetical protein
MLCVHVDIGYSLHSFFYNFIQYLLLLDFYISFYNILSHNC